MGHTLNADGEPEYTPTPTQTVADLQAAVAYASKIGGLLKVTASERTSLTSGQTKPGWLIVETDTGNVYRVLAGSPQGVKVIEDSGWVEYSSLPSSGFSVVTGNLPRFRLINGIVHYVIVATFSGTWTNNWNVLSVPTGMAPAKAIPAVSFYGDTVRECSFTAAGGLAILRAGAGGIALSGSYPRG